MAKWKQGLNQNAHKFVLTPLSNDLVLWRGEAKGRCGKYRSKGIGAISFYKSRIISATNQPFSYIFQIDFSEGKKNNKLNTLDQIWVS